MRCFQPASWADSCMARWSVGPKARRITLHYMAMLGEQLTAMLPLSLLQVGPQCNWLPYTPVLHISSPHLLATGSSALALPSPTRPHTVVAAGGCAGYLLP